MKVGAESTATIGSVDVAMDYINVRVGLSNLGQSHTVMEAMDTIGSKGTASQNEVRARISAC